MACLSCNAALAQSSRVQIEAHPGYGRVVFTFAAVTTFEMSKDGDIAMLHFSESTDIPSAGQTRNVLEVRGGRGMALIAIVPGGRVRARQVESRIVVDILDPPAVKHRLDVSGVQILQRPPADRAPAASSPATAPTGASVVAVPITQQAIAEVSASSTTLMAATSPPLELSQPAALSTARDNAMLKFDTAVGASAFKRSDGDYVVFDERSSISLEQLKAVPGFALASIQLLPAATVLHVGQSLTSPWHLERRQEGWLLALGSPAVATPIILENENGRLQLPVAGPGQVVVVPDGVTGEELLVGTVRAAGPSINAERKSPEFTISVSSLGVVVEPHTDRVALHVTSRGFVIDTPGRALAISGQPAAQQPLTDAAMLTRRFDFPNQSTAALSRRMQDEVATASAAPPLARFRPRMAAAQTMLSLGMGAEAEALLQLAIAEQPESASDADVRALKSIAGWLAGRAENNDDLFNPALNGTDEIAMWRAVVKPPSDTDAAMLAATVPLVASYPIALRDRVLPAVVDAIVRSDSPGTADPLLAHWPTDPLFAEARALRSAAKGDTDQALSDLDTLATSRDRLAASKAATEAVELRLRTGKFSLSQAADALESQILAWRGDRREIAIRLRIAELRALSGAPRPALTLLRETEELYPEMHAELVERMTAVFVQALTGSAAENMSPLEFVELAEENAGIAGETLSPDVAGLLADRLIMLDLPQRAGPLLKRTIVNSAPGEAKAAVGLRLAWLRTGENDLAGALEALEQSGAESLPTTLVEARALAAARVWARQGNVGAALGALADLGTPAADLLRTDIQSQAKNWPAAATSMSSFVQKTILPGTVLNTPQQQAILRLATLRSEAGDAEGLYALGLRESVRMASSSQSAAFATLTATPIREITDLKRSAAEMVLARAMPRTQ